MKKVEVGVFGKDKMKRRKERSIEQEEMMIDQQEQNCENEQEAAAMYFVWKTTIIESIFQCMGFTYKLS